MGKSDFLDILKDYLKEGMSDEEISEITLKYEEYFYNSVKIGLTESQAVMRLGSPKGIAEEYLSDNNSNLTKDENVKTSLPHKLNSYINRKLSQLRVSGCDDEIIKFNKVYSFIMALLFIITSSFAAILIGCSIFSLKCAFVDIKELLLMMNNISLVAECLVLVCIVGIIMFEALIFYSLFKLTKNCINFFNSSIKVIDINKQFIK